MLAFHSSYSRVTHYSSPGVAPLKSNSTVTATPALAEKLPQTALEPEPSLRQQPLASGFGPRATGVTAYQAVQGAGAENPYAQTILNFVGLQLQRDVADGASQEELQSRLEAGFKGFSQGYQEAFDQLDASGLLSDEVKAAISDTQAKVFEGINQLAAQLGLKSPVPASASPEAAAVEPALGETAIPRIPPSSTAPLPTAEQPKLQLYSVRQRLIAQLMPSTNPEDILAAKKADKAQAEKTLAARLEPTTLSQGQARDFSFSLTTRDGDEVTINASSRLAQVAKVGGYAGYGISATSQQSSSFDLTIDGDLDEEELAAINDLLDKVGTVSDTFFNGNVEDAFNQAVNMGYNADEIGGFALNLVRVDVQKMQNAYSEPNTEEAATKPINIAAEHWQALGEFFAQLQELTRSMQEYGFSTDVIADAADAYSATAHSDKAKHASLGDFIKQVA